MATLPRKRESVYRLLSDIIVGGWEAVWEEVRVIDEGGWEVFAGGGMDRWMGGLRR